MTSTLCYFGPECSFSIFSGLYVVSDEIVYFVILLTSQMMTGCPLTSMDAILSLEIEIKNVRLNLIELILLGELHEHDNLLLYHI